VWGDFAAFTYVSGSSLDGPEENRLAGSKSSGADALRGLVPTFAGAMTAGTAAAAHALILEEAKIDYENDPAVYQQRLRCR
jgi:hypothetical protein